MYIPVTLQKRMYASTFSTEGSYWLMHVTWLVVLYAFYN